MEQFSVFEFAQVVLALASLVTASASLVTARNTRKTLKAQEVAFKRQEKLEQQRALKETIKSEVKEMLPDILKGIRGGGE